MFMGDDFLLQSQPAIRLYHEFAKDEPILDYHNHLSAADIANNRSFQNLYEVWLEEDHYKWRAMRAAGCDESVISGAAAPRTKFNAWAATVPETLCNPLFHWTHLELKRYFGIEKLLTPETADEIWEEAAAQLTDSALSVHGILGRFKVRALCTTDDPVDSLPHHQSIRESGLETRVLPTFRPDGALAVDQPKRFNQWLQRLVEVSNVAISRLHDFVDALKLRHDYFHEQGCRLSDHDLKTCPRVLATEKEAEEIFDQVRNGQPADEERRERFIGYMMTHLCRWDTERNWTKQLHLGVFRNNNERVYRESGADMGYDSIGDFSQGRALQAFLSRTELEGHLPQTILYNNNPRDNYLFATMAGNFPGKVQYGAAWWYMDQKDGIETQLRDLGNVGLLSRFLGMLTDSRSFMSLPRHEYFRRILCNFVGAKVEQGELPHDDELIGAMIQRICYANAKEFLQLDPEPVCAA